MSIKITPKAARVTVRNSLSKAKLLAVSCGGVRFAFAVVRLCKTMLLRVDWISNLRRNYRRDHLR